MAYGDRIREARKKKGWTQEELAEKIGVAKSTLAGYESGAREPNIMVTQKLLLALDIDSDYLFRDERASLGSCVFTLEYTEIEHIKRYRSLNPAGKRRIEYEIRYEMDRAREIAEKEARISELEAVSVPGDESAPKIESASGAETSPRIESASEAEAAPKIESASEAEASPKTSSAPETEKSRS